MKPRHRAVKAVGMGVLQLPRIIDILIEDQNTKRMDEALEETMENGQIATQYVDLEGNPTSDIRYNPNGSVLAIEGITSPDGRVFGKMGHSERIGKGLYKNVSGEFDMKIFRSAVEYFSASSGIALISSHIFSIKSKLFINLNNLFFYNNSLHHYMTCMPYLLRHDHHQIQ